MSSGGASRFNDALNSSGFIRLFRRSVAPAAPRTASRCARRSRGSSCSAARAQNQEDESGAWVHAHLHRVHGEEGNAGYWHRRAGKPHAQTPLDEEWDEIVAALLSKRTGEPGVG